MTRNLNNALNFVGSQLLWLAAVGGAGNGMPWLGPAFLLLFAAYQLSPPCRARGDVALMGIALLVGLVVDSIMAATGLARYASPFPFEWMAPLWILSLWVGFALTFNHSIAYLVSRPWVAAALGGFAGPFSYWVAARAWGAVEFAPPTWPALLVLGLLWALAMPLLAFASRQLAATGLPSITQVETGT